MCGIAGFLAAEGRRVHPRCLRAMADAMARRGPDDEGFATGVTALAHVQRDALDGHDPTTVGLAHRRLSILDLSAGGHQPKVSADGHCWITYNGEIYNYVELRDQLRSAGWKFATTSDTEVVLTAYLHWGASCVERFNGIFAFALWDCRTNTLFCARDHFGIKPFYYARLADAFYFASSTQALLTLDHDWQIDRQGVLDYCHAMYSSSPGSVISGMRKLMPGCTLTIGRDGKPREAAYWRLTGVGSSTLTSSTSEEFHALLDNVIQLQMRSDVKVGTFLSGGIDSSAVVALMHRNGVADLDTFSVGYEGQAVDERPFARRVARQVGAREHELSVTPDLVRREARAAITEMSEPIADSAFLPTWLLSRMAAAEGIKVVLNGTGGDEVLGGYHRYAPPGAARRALQALPRAARPVVARTFGPHSVHGLRLRYPVVDLMGSIGGDLGFLAEHFLTPAELVAYCERAQASMGATLAAVPEQFRRYSAMHFDLCHYLVDDLLMLLDAMAMSASVEGRVPFLDVRLVEFLYRLPEETHFASGLKTFAKREFSGLLPREILHRDKLGFGGPVPMWIRALGPELREFFSAEQCLTSSFSLAPEAFRRQLLEANSRPSDGWRVFRLFVFEAWYRDVFLRAQSERRSRASAA